ncbi:Flp family type IVb pilin [Erwinia sp.]|uniref:Flp family type IVb pilin n=1 Tax=Erwinia citreus TaxID=558 RepID=UPI003C7148CE
MNDFITKYSILTYVRMEQLVKDQRGVTAIEYALIGVAMATLLSVILGNTESGFLGKLNESFKKIADAIESVTSSNPGTP